MVVLPVNYNNEMFYFVINEKNEDDYLFCKKNGNDIIQITDKITLDNLLTCIDGVMNGNNK